MEKDQKMDPTIKAKWIAALRSGDYKQARNKLRGPNQSGEVGYCCLGVLCDVMAKDGIGQWDGNRYTIGSDDVAKLPNSDKALHIMIEGGLIEVSEAGVLPFALSYSIGVSTVGGLKRPVMVDGDFTDSLTGLNDDAKLNFNEIADVIEAQL